MWFITSEPVPRASWGKHVLWMSSSEYLMNWWVTVWSLAKAGPNIIRACWQSPEGTVSVAVYRHSFWSLLANKWKHWFHPTCRHGVPFSLSLHLQLSPRKSKDRGDNGPIRNSGIQMNVRRKYLSRFIYLKLCFFAYLLLKNFFKDKHPLGIGIHNNRAKYPTIVL